MDAVGIAARAIKSGEAQLLIAGVNLFLLGTIIRAMLGWSLWVALIVAAAIRLTDEGLRVRTVSMLTDSAIATSAA